MASTGTGRWAGRLLVLGAALLGLFFVLVGTGQRGGDTFFSNPSLALSILGAGFAAIAAGVAGLLALRRGDRSVVVIVAVVAGTFAAFWVVAELAFPH